VNNIPSGRPALDKTALDKTAPYKIVAEPAVKTQGLQVSILGCGWLGRPLARRFAASGWRVLGSTTTAAKLDGLRSEGIEASLLTLNPQPSDAQVARSLMSSPIVVVNTPPRRAGGTPAEQLENLLQAAADPPTSLSGKHVIYVSSTSVYGPGQGDVDETTSPLPTEENGKKLLEAEALLRQLAEEFGFAATIVRPGGLLGWDRHPARYLAGRTGLKDPAGPINLVHGEDVCTALFQLASVPSTGVRLFNVVANQHPTREAFYTKACELLGLAPAKFEKIKDAPASDSKRVAAAKIREVTQMPFKYDDLILATKEMARQNAK